ncbi:GAF domain-containing protein [Naumannella huperziae]
MPEPAPTPRDPTPTRVLRAVSECAVDLADLRDPHLVLQGIVRRTRDLLGTDMAYLSLNDLGRGETHIEYTDGVRTEAYRTIRMPLGTGVLGAVAAGGVDVQTTDYTDDAAMNHLPRIDDIVVGEGVRAIHGCPIRVGGHVVGALLVAQRTRMRFGRRQIAALRRMAEAAAVALELERLRAGGADPVAARFHDELTARVPDGPEAVCTLIGARVGHPVELIEPGAEVDGVAAAALGTAVAASLHTAAAVGVEGADATVLAARHGGGHVATVICRVPHARLGERERQLLGRSSPAVGAAVAVQRNQVEALSRGHAELVDDLLASATPGKELLARARALGFAPRRPVLVLVARRFGGSREAFVRAARAALAPAPALASSHDGHLCVLAQPAGPEHSADAVLAAVRPNPAVLGWSIAADGLAEVAAAHVTARRAAHALEALGAAAAAADPPALGLAGVLVAGNDPALVDELITGQLGPVLAYDERHGTRLAETAWAVLESGSSTGSAGRLHVHPNTVRQRCERIGALIGADWRRPPRSVDLHFALRLWRVRAELG